MTPHTINTDAEWEAFADTGWRTALLQIDGLPRLVTPDRSTGVPYTLTFHVEDAQTVADEADIVPLDNFDLPFTVLWCDRLPTPAELLRALAAAAAPDQRLTGHEIPLPGV